MEASTVKTRILQNPWFAAVVNISGVVAGYLGAHFDHEIADSFLRPWLLAEGTFSWGASLFWTVCIFFGIGLALTIDRQSKDSAKTAGRIEQGTKALDEKVQQLGTQVIRIEDGTVGLDNHVNDLMAQSKQLLESATDIGRQVQRLHSLPPPGFLQHFSTGATRLVGAAMATQVQSPEDRAQLVRVLLNFFLTLASKFDHDGESCRYGANVMIFRSTKGLDHEMLAEIQGRLRFLEDSVHVSQLRGVLELIPGLSVATNSASQPDPLLIPIVLPVSANPASPSLPGAPTAFLTGTALLFEAESNLEKVDKARHFSGTVIGQMRTFFEERKGVIESFMCFPVRSPFRTDQAPIAVLNLHRNRPNPLAGEKLPLLDALFAPLCMALGAVLDTDTDLAPKMHPSKESPND